MCKDPAGLFPGVLAAVAALALLPQANPGGPGDYLGLDTACPAPGQIVQGDPAMPPAPSTWACVPSWEPDMGMGMAVPDHSLYLQGQETALKPQSLSMGVLSAVLSVRWQIPRVAAGTSA